MAHKIPLRGNRKKTDPNRDLDPFIYRQLDPFEKETIAITLKQKKKLLHILGHKKVHLFPRRK